MREIVSPDIYESRYQYMSNKSVWYYIAVINQGLSINSVDSDGVIKITIKYNMDTDLIEQIIGFYKSVGWTEIGINITGNVNSLYGSTIFTFNPPESTILSVKGKIRKEL